MADRGAGFGLVALAGFIPLFAALGIWAATLVPIDPIATTDLGLPSVLPLAFWASLPLLAGGFVFSILSNRAPRILPYAYLAALICVLHATPAIDYGTLRYPWAWRHLGIVDFIQRHGAVDRWAPFYSVYHNWPGLFAATAMIGDFLHVKDFTAVARWVPTILNVLYAVTLTIIVRQFTLDRRLVLASVWIFLCANWLGQDYYSPQGFAFLFYLVLIALVLRFLRPPADQPLPWPKPLMRLAARIAAWADRGGPPAGEPLARLPRAVVTASAYLLVVAIAATHPLTPVVLLVALAGLVALRRLRIRFFAVAVAIVVGWDVVVAHPFLLQRFNFEGFGSFLANVNDSVADNSLMSDEQVIVSWIVRLLCLTVGVAAVAGGAARLLRGHYDGPAAALTLAAAPLLVATSYGGEVVFRVYLFALPFMSFFAGALFFTTEHRRSTAPLAAAFAIFCTVLAAAFVFANNGRDRSYVASRDEIASVRWLLSSAPPRSLLVEADGIYPSKFLNYENFTYVSIADEPTASRQAIVDDAAGVLGGWASDRKYAATYVVLTRSQIHAHLELFYTVPSFDIEAVERSLRDSPRFRLVRSSRDVRIYAYVNPEEQCCSGVEP